MTQPGFGPGPRHARPLADEPEAIRGYTSDVTPEFPIWTDGGRA